MPAQLSIIIPTLNAEGELPATLLALMEGVHEGLIREVVVSDGGSTDGTLDIAREWGAEIVAGPPGRGGQLARGADASVGAWCLFLHADTHLAPGWTGAVQERLPNGAPGYFWLRFRASGAAPVFVARWANFRSRLFRLPYGDQALLISRRDYDAIGGYSDQPLMEDVEFASRLKLLSPLNHYAFTGADRYLRDGWFRRGARNLILLTRYKLGARPEDLAKAYSGSRN